MTLFFNTDVSYKGKSCLESAADDCLQPVRYLFNGKSVSIVDSKVVSIDRGLAEIKFRLVVICIIVLVPFFFIGTLLKLAATLSPTVRKYRQIAAEALEKNPTASKTDAVSSKTLSSKTSAAPDNEYQKKLETEAKKMQAELDETDPFTPPQYELKPETSLKVMFDQLGDSRFELQKKLTSKEAWKDPAIVKEYGALIEKAHECADLLLQRVHQLAKTKMESEKVLKNDGKDDKRIGYVMAYMLDYNRGEFLNRYFEGLLMAYRLGACSMYHDDKNSRIISDKTQTPHREAFFQKGTVQYKCRRLYNSFWDQLEKYELVGALDKVDKRLLKWAQKDLGIFSSDPDMQPSRGYVEGDAKAGTDISDDHWHYYINYPKDYMIAAGLWPESERPDLFSKTKAKKTAE